MGDSNQLFESLFRPKIGDAGEVDFLKQLTTDHPYFSPAHFFLLQRTNENDPEYVEQAAKTALLFNNPFWLNLQLQEARDGRIATNDSFLLPAEEDMTHPETETPGTDEHQGSSKIRDTRPGDPVAVEAGEAGRWNGQPADQAVDAFPVEVAGVEEVLVEEEINNKEQEVPGSNEDNIPPKVSKNLEEGGEQLSAGEEGSFVDDYPESVVSLEPLIETGPESRHTAQPQPPVAGDEFETPPPPPVEAAGNELDAEESEIDPEEQKELEPLKVRLNLEETISTGDTPTFEPLHTTDYFASQGIRLSNEIQSTDKLGKQLKSFTEWLKTMKKIHTEQPADQINQTDVTIQKLAEKSNTEDEVVTEAMADVLIRQGKGGKAREVYRKLSLLNPAKTAYFAAKIDQLKEQ